MTGIIEIRAFMFLTDLFAERGWPSPYRFPADEAMSAVALLEALRIPRGRVESLIVNHRAVGVDGVTVHPGDRVALVPPGVPGPHRLLLGIRHGKEPAPPPA